VPRPPIRAPQSFPKTAAAASVIVPTRCAHGLPTTLIVPSPSTGMDDRASPPLGFVIVRNQMCAIDSLDAGQPILKARMLSEAALTCEERG